MSPEFTTGLFVESVLLIFLVFVIWCFCVCLRIVMSNILKINVRVGIYPNMCLYVLSPVLWCPLRFTHKNDARFVFTSCFFVGGLMSYLRNLWGGVAHSGVQHILTIWVTWWLSYERHEPLTFLRRLGSPLVFGGVCVAHRFGFLTCVFLFVMILVCPTLPVFPDCLFLLAPSVFPNVCLS